ncbi:MAG: hypothetical protein A2428_06795 [Bdellovibrionales bacterium RIFOXYC1_FULL_54_43]|nr:MAG: hypothetical protein A2428_06795 [Bdellovibrionales bacterium RIFOXYC1_FULL_54_43]OFZ80015.1 MAG: hypothetical protein A2603_02265 [Bdellovibrionales bacterium RIFOXYD1_FULL_55_31]
MKVLVTGASGFIGSTLIEQLSSLGFEVHALMRKTSSLSNLSHLEGKFERVEGDLSNFDSLRNALKDVKYVFHLAGATAAPNRDAYFEHNARGTERLARAVAEVGPGLTRFVHVSSLAAAGPSSSLNPRVEADTEQPVSYYGESKLQGEKEVLKYKDAYPVTIIRPPIVYGPKDKGVFTIIQTVAKNFMPVLQGSAQGGHKYYSAIHAEDLCRGIVQAGVAPVEKVPSGEIFYVSGNEVHTYREILTTIAECLERDPFSFNVPKIAIKAAATALSVAGFITRKSFPLNLDKVNELLPDYWICSNEKAKKLLRFSPEFDLRTGMSHSIEWYKRHRWI